jgi:hypothetical protein
MVVTKLAHPLLAKVALYLYNTILYVNTVFVYIRLIVVVVTASKSTRQANRDQASSDAGAASAAVSANKPGRAKKRSRKEILLSDDESTTGEKTLTIQTQHTISKASTSEGGNGTVEEAVKSLFEELMKSRKDLISQLQELEDPIYAAEILTNKKRIIEVRPIFYLTRYFWLIIRVVFPDFS